MQAYQEFVDLLNKPGVIGVLATDTVYGVVARATDKEAVRRLYELKRREGKPGTVIAADLESFVELGVKKRYLQPVSDYWPGAVSVVVPVGDPALQYLHDGKGSLAVRVPDVPVLRELLKQTGPLLTSSANQPGEPPATTPAEARAYFGDGVDFIQNAGELAGRAPSTIIRIIDDEIEIIRQGAVTIGG